MRSRLFILALLCTAGAGRPAGQTAAAPPAALRDGEVAVRIETPFGFMAVAVDTKGAPTAAAMFLKAVDDHVYNGGRFVRATPSPSALIQGEINSQKRSEGAEQPDIVILIDGQDSAGAGRVGFAGSAPVLFGRVTDGLSVARRIQQLLLEGSTLYQTVAIVWISRT
jgi:cyclophilin family peptidyl-prolyl cis-trans isomerase